MNNTNYFLTKPRWHYGKVQMCISATFLSAKCVFLQDGSLCPWINVYLQLQRILLLICAGHVHIEYHIALIHEICCATSHPLGRRKPQAESLYCRLSVDFFVLAVIAKSLKGQSPQVV